jgi:selenocysteine lyase/cysteine desulfurase
MGDYLQYLDDRVEHPPLELISLGPPDSKSAYCLFNTILLAIVKNKGVPFCNIELKKFLDRKNIVVSIGSACLTTSTTASHVLQAIGALPVIKRGVIRISFGDYNTTAEAHEFVRMLIAGIAEQTGDITQIKDPESKKTEHRRARSRVKKS